MPTEPDYRELLKNAQQCTDEVKAFVPEYSTTIRSLRTPGKRWRVESLKMPKRDREK